MSAAEGAPSPFPRRSSPAPRRRGSGEDVPDLIRTRVAEGKLGRKSGSGLLATR